MFQVFWSLKTTCRGRSASRTTMLDPDCWGSRQIQLSPVLRPQQEGGRPDIHNWLYSWVWMPLHVLLWKRKLNTEGIELRSFKMETKAFYNISKNSNQTLLSLLKQRNCGIFIPKFKFNSAGRPTFQIIAPPHHRGVFSAKLAPPCHCATFDGKIAQLSCI